MRDNKEYNTLVELTHNQENPGAARPSDFEIENERLEGGGQCGDSPAEYRALLDESDKENSKSPFVGGSEPDHTVRYADVTSWADTSKGKTGAALSGKRKASVRKTDKS